MPNNAFWKGILIVGVIAIVSAAIIAYAEIKSASDFCDKEQGKFKINIFTNNPYSCDGKSIVKYSKEWEFDKDNITLSIEYP